MWFVFRNTFYNTKLACMSEKMFIRLSYSDSAYAQIPHTTLTVCNRAISTLQWNNKDIEVTLFRSNGREHISKFRFRGDWSERQWEVNDAAADGITPSYFLIRLAAWCWILSVWCYTVQRSTSGLFIIIFNPCKVLSESENTPFVNKSSEAKVNEKRKLGTAKFNDSSNTPTNQSHSPESSYSSIH